MTKAEIALLAAALVMEVAGVILVAGAAAGDGSPVPGIALLAIGLVFLVISMARRAGRAGG